MKSTLFLLSAVCVLLIGGGALAVSCASDTRKSLQNTSWTKEEEGSVVTLSFSSKTALLTDIYGGVKKEYTYNYSYTYPTVILTLKSDTKVAKATDASSGATSESVPSGLTGTVSGDTMTLTDNSTGNTFIVLTSK
jgi:hypothetical protein